jgi:hypothetical protein
MPITVDFHGKLYNFQICTKTALWLCTVVWIFKLNSVALVRERTMPTERPPLVGEVVPTFADRECCVVSATDSLRSLISIF